MLSVATAVLIQKKLDPARPQLGVFSFASSDFLVLTALRCFALLRIALPCVALLRIALHCISNALSASSMFVSLPRLARQSDHSALPYIKKDRLQDAF